MKKILILGLLIGLSSSSSFAEDQPADTLFDKNSGDQAMFDNYVVGGASKKIKSSSVSNSEIRKLVKQFDLTKNNQLQNNSQGRPSKEEQLVPDLNTKSDPIQRPEVVRQVVEQKQATAEPSAENVPQARGAISPGYYETLIKQVKERTDQVKDENTVAVDKNGNKRVKRNSITNENKF